MVGSSVLLTAKKALPYNALRTETVKYRHKIFTKGGLSFNHKDKLNIPYLLTCGSLKWRRDIILWHDTIKNSITKHRGNNQNPFEVSKLVELLNKFTPRLRAIV